MKNNGRTDWAAVRHAYCCSDQKVGDICRQHSVSIPALYYHRNNEDWPPRNKTASASAHKSKQIHKSKIERLYLLLDRLMKEFEMEPMNAAGGEGMPKTGTAERERSARTLSSLIRSFEKIKELEAENVSKTQQTCDDELNEADEKEAETLRNILFEKIEKLVQAENT